VLVDDLITMGATEPYRMFTSRAEYRLMLREDNADLRLTEHANKLGLINEKHWRLFNKKRDAIEKESNRLEKIWVGSKSFPIEVAEKFLGKTIRKDTNLLGLLKRPDFNYYDISKLPNIGIPEIDPKVAEQVEVQAKYSGYIKRQEEEVERNLQHEETTMPENIDYTKVRGLSAEVIEKLSKHRPVSLGQASRIQGITPAAISLLRIHLKRQLLLLKQTA
jgi:tRNA uridine 5-carboxymethylaminomethyl modification enzyme